MRLALNEAMKKIKEDVLRIINMGKESIYHAVKYILTGDESSLEKINKLEVDSDILNLDIQDYCLATMIRQQPAARDMRFISSMMYISSFFERICDLSQEIIEQKVAKLSGDLKDVETSIMWMSQKVISMIDLISDSIRDGVIDELKDKLEAYDNEVDSLFNDAREKIKNFLKQCKGDVDNGIKLLYIIRFLERIGDIVAKTGARLIYIEEGKHVLIK